MVGAHLRHFKQWRDEAVSDAAVVDAFADSVNARIESLHRVIDDNAAIAMDAAGFSQRRVRTDADCHDDEVGRDCLAVRKADRRDAAIRVADQFLRIFFKQEFQAALLKRVLQHLAGDIVELTLHQAAGQMHDGDIHAAQFQAIRGFESEQAATDDDGMLVRFSRGDHGIRVMDVAIGNHAREFLARHRQHERVRAGRHEQAVIFRHGAVFGDDLPARAVDARDFLAKVERDIVFGIPVDIVQHDVLDRLLASQHRREQDAIVIGIRLGAEHRDVIHIRRDLEQLF